MVLQLAGERIQCARKENKEERWGDNDEIRGLPLSSPKKVITQVKKKKHPPTIRLGTPMGGRRE